MNDSFASGDNPMLRSTGGVSAGDIAEAVLDFYIEGDDDLIGLLAYALYERQKREFVLGHRKRNGRSPSEAEVAAVTSNYLSNDLRNTLRDRASQVLSSYAETYVEAMEPQIQLNAVNSDALRQVREIEKSLAKRTGFWRQVRAGFVISLLMMVLFGLLAIAAVFFRSNIVDAWHALIAPTPRT